MLRSKTSLPEFNPWPTKPVGTPFIPKNLHPVQSFGKTCQPGNNFPPSHHLFQISSWHLLYPTGQNWHCRILSTIFAIPWTYGSLSNPYTRCCSAFVETSELPTESSSVNFGFRLRYNGIIIAMQPGKCGIEIGWNTAILQRKQLGINKNLNWKRGRGSYSGWSMYVSSTNLSTSIAHGKYTTNSSQFDRTIANMRKKNGQEEPERHKQLTNQTETAAKSWDRKSVV